MNQTHIHLFVYGTLRQGSAVHERYCRNVTQITPASVWGRLYLLTDGYPALDVPEESIITIGTGNILNDAALEQQMEQAVH